MLDVILRGGSTRIHEYCAQRHRELGPLYYEKLGTVKAVFVSCPKLFEEIYRRDGKYPEHLVPESWKLYNKIRKIERGLFFMNGPLWLERRRSLNRIFLRTNTVQDHGEIFQEVVNDVLERWREFSRLPGGVVPNLERELYNWSVESLGTLIFGRRLGCVQRGEPGKREEVMHEFVQCVQKLFVESAKLTMIPPGLAHRLQLPTWKRFVAAADRALELAREYVEENVRQIVASAQTGQPVQGVLSEMLLKEDIKEEEIVRIITDLFLAAADTTSHSTQWSLYLLSRHPACQERLLGEIQDVVGRGGEVEPRHVDNLPYVKAVMKEALRLYPVAPFLSRYAGEDLELGGYHIPAGTLFLMSVYSTGRDARYFADPLAFRPERWIRQSPSQRVCSYASIPFGIGARACIGRRVAELQMNLLLAKTVEKFHLTAANSKEVESCTRLITTPREPIKLNLRERRRP